MRVFGRPAFCLPVHDCTCCPPHSDGGRCVPLAPCAVKEWTARRSQIVTTSRWKGYRVCARGR
eukprot:9201524-Pyramimonas_sp.AAC.1